MAKLGRIDVDRKRDRFTIDVMRKVKTFRVIAGYTQEQVAQSVGLTQSAWSHYERGYRSITLETMLLLPEILQCSIADLLPDSVVTAVDQRRSRDMRLEEIFVLWPELSDEAKRNLLETVRLLHNTEQANRSRLADLAKAESQRKTKPLA